MAHGIVSTPNGCGPAGGWGALRRRKVHHGRVTTTTRTLFRRKPIETIDDDTGAEGGLKRHLGLWQLTAIGIGGIIGAGIFTLAGTVANGVAGPAVLISFLVAGVASAAAALSYAEFAGLIPKAGSAYTYGYAVLGEIVGWFIGWDLLLEYTAIVAVVAIGISGYVGFLVGQFGIDLPAWMLGAPGTGDGHVIDVFAIILCLVTAFVLTRGIRSAARFEFVAVGIKVALVVLIVVLGVFHINSANYSPYFPFGFGGVMTGAATVFFAVFGYDAMSTAAEESVDARKHMPKAILLSLGISMVLYVLATLVLTGMQKYTDIDPASGFSSAFASVGLGGVANVIAIGAIVGIVTVLVTFMLGASRVWFSMSRDGLMPKWFSKTDPKRHVPTRVTWILGIASAILAGVLPIGVVAELTNIGILLAFVVVCSAVIVLRYRQPDLDRQFRLPFMPVIPIIGVIASLWLVTFLQWETWVRFAVWFAIGLGVYFGYSRKHSKLAAGEPTDATKP
jgi:APA family basic amino acid/polyamine antiporter